jgi:S1-C subfamily serine protease
MAFCINCGVHNPGDAVFCLSCGQTIYKPPEKTISPQLSIWFRARVPLIVSALLLVGMTVGILSFRKPAESNQTNGNAKKSSVEPSHETKKFDEAVLMIIATNSKGSPLSQGSGFILTPDGLAGSNYHVLRGATEAFAECCDGRKFEIVSIEGADLDKDLVVFQLYEMGKIEKPKNLPHVTLAPLPNGLKVGQRVIAVGSPQGLENTVSDGILSAVRESDSVRYLQITAPISPGSSGGPVLDSDGRMIGVATFQLTKGQNLNFAVAADYIQPLLDQHFAVSMKEFQNLVHRAKHQSGVSSTTSNPDTVRSENDESHGSSLTGQFGGIVHNVTGDTSAAFGIIVSDEQGILSGCMGVQQPLFGSGPLSGFVVDSDVTFIVTSAIGEITFEGKQKNGSITGTYTVQHPDGTEQQGTFRLQRTSSKGPGEGFDSSGCPTDAEIHN